MPKYMEKEQDRRRSDESMTWLVLISGAIVGVVAISGFLRETSALNGPRPRHPWDA